MLLRGSVTGVAMRTHTPPACIEYDPFTCKINCLPNSTRRSKLKYVINPIRTTVGFLWLSNERKNRFGTMAIRLKNSFEICQNIIWNASQELHFNSFYVLQLFKQVSTSD